MSNGDLFMCPYIIMSRSIEEKYFDHRIGHIGNDAISDIVTRVLHEEREYLFCSHREDYDGLCYFLHSGMRMINQFVSTYFDRRIVYFQENYD